VIVRQRLQPRVCALKGNWFKKSHSETPFSTVIACDKREAFAQGSEATKQSIYPLVATWIASLRSQ
jgi:hypothetical protein